MSELAKSEIERRMAHFESVLRNEGVKRTHQRIEIFREVALAGDHPDAEQVFQRVRERMPTVSLDTVYRTLWMLDDLGLIRTLGPGRGRARFDANLNSHHHFVCKECGFTRDFYSEELDTLKLPDMVHDYGAIGTTHVEVFGICQECLKTG